MSWLSLWLAKPAKRSQQAPPLAPRNGLLPGLLQGLAATVAESTYDRTAYLYTPRPVRRTSPAGLPAEAEYEYVGVWPCRLDAMVREPAGDGRQRRAYGLTLPYDAPMLTVGDVARVDGLNYRVDQAHDDRLEVVIRRYVVSVAQSDLSQAPR